MELIRTGCPPSVVSVMSTLGCHAVWAMAERVGLRQHRFSFRGAAAELQSEYPIESSTISPSLSGISRNRAVPQPERGPCSVVYLAHPRTCRKMHPTVKPSFSKPHCMFRGVLKSADGAGLLSTISASRAPAATAEGPAPRPGAGHAQSVHTLHPGQGSRFWFHGMSGGGSRFRFHGDCGCKYARRICNGEARLHVPVPHTLLGGSQVLLEFTGSGRHPAARGCNAPCGRVLLRRPRSPPCRPPWRREAPWRRR